MLRRKVNEMKYETKLLVLGVALIALSLVVAAIGLAIAWSNFQECRDHGFSLLFCLFR
jgi:hypothetical protein